MRKGQKRELAVLLCFSSVRITGLLDMAIYLQLIIKSPNRTALDFKAKIKGQMSEFNHNGQQESLMQIFMSDHRELFGFVKNYDSPFFFVCIVICLLRYYVYIFFM